MSRADDVAERRRLPIPVDFHHHRTPEQLAHARAVLATLAGLPFATVAAWCAAEMAYRGGKWARFTGPQSVMTARYYELARAHDQRKAA